MAVLAYTPERIFMNTAKSRGIRAMINWLAHRQTSHKRVSIPAKVLEAARESGRIEMRVLGDGIIVYAIPNDDLGITNGVIDDLIREGVRGRDLPEAYRKRIAEMQDLLARREAETIAWGKANPNATREFLAKFVTDGK